MHLKRIGSFQKLFLNLKIQIVHRPSLIEFEKKNISVRKFQLADYNNTNHTYELQKKKS